MDRADYCLCKVDEVEKDARRLVISRDVRRESLSDKSMKLKNLKAG